jgi:excisionase family DNA binding protein
VIEVDHLTTGQAARYCQVCNATILNWIKQGKLEAYTTPGGHFRIRLSDLLSFLERYEMPVDPRLTGRLGDGRDEGRDNPARV